MTRWFGVWRRLRDLERLAVTAVVTADPEAQAAWDRVRARVRRLDA